MNAQLPLHMVEVFKIWGIGAAAPLAFALLSELFLRWQEKKKLLPQDGAANSFLFLFGPIMEGVIANGLLIAALFVVYQLTPLRVRRGR
jgi:hypothetical protein